MKSPVKAVVKASKLNKRDFVLAIEASVLLLFARLTIKFLPYSCLRSLLGRHMRTGSAPGPGADDTVIKRVSYWLNTVAHHLPLDCSCLPRALAGRLMLKRRGIETTLYLGVGKDQDRELIAHAWLMAKGIPVTGGKDNSHLAQVARFR